MLFARNKHHERWLIGCQLLFSVRGLIYFVLRSSAYYLLLQFCSTGNCSIFAKVATEWILKLPTTCLGPGDFWTCYYCHPSVGIVSTSPALVMYLRHLLNIGINLYQRFKRTTISWRGFIFCSVLFKDCTNTSSTLLLFVLGKKIVAARY